jgi:hypothetical protein
MKSQKSSIMGPGLLLLLCIVLGASSPASATVGPPVLPDNRAWEQVSPVDKNHADIFYAHMVAASDGHGIAYKSRGSFAGQSASHGATMDNYISVRSPTGWTTEGITPPHGLVYGLTQQGYEAFSEDLSKGIVSQSDSAVDPLLPGSPQGLNLYLRDTSSRTFSLLNGLAGQVTSSGGFSAASADFSHVLFQSPSQLTSDSPCHSLATVCSYEWDNGVLRLASIALDGTPVTGVVGGDSNSNKPLGSLEGAMSDDGTHLFFTSKGEIFMRANHTTTLPVSASELTTPDGSSAASFFHAGEAAHGEKAIFTTTAAKVDADMDKTNDLYLWDSNGPVGGRLTLVSEDHNPAAPVGAEVDSPITNGFLSGGVLASSDDLGRIYFVADNQIVAGEPETPGPKLFLWDDTGIEPTVTYVATLSPVDREEGLWRGLLVDGAFVRPAQASKNGDRIVFVSHADLTGYESGGEAQIYVYDAVSGQIECASCVSDAYPRTGYIGLTPHTEFNVNAPINRRPRNLSENGRVFFETARGLVPEDSNGRIDVYEYEHRELHLISAGTGDGDSRFADADATGDNVFFTTNDRLVGWDKDENADLYDARIGGGFPEPPPSPPACEGDSCQPPPVVPNDPTPASAGFHGPGNQQVQRKRRQRHRRHDRHPHPRRGKLRAAHKHG